MAGNSIKVGSRLPRPKPNELKDPKGLEEYLNSLVRNIEVALNNLYNSNNTTWIINPRTTASYTSLSIAGDTVDQDKIRDNLTSLIYVLKNNNRLN